MNTESKTVEFSLSLAEVNQILEALGNQPYVRVFQLISNLQRQAESQLCRLPTSNDAPAPVHRRAVGE